MADVGPRSRRLGAALVALALGVSAALTLTPEASSGPRDPFLCLTCSVVASADAIRNVLLFMPLGAGAALLGASPARAALAGLVVAAGVEATQAFLPGRDASARDLLLNGLGAAAGAVVLRLAVARGALDARHRDVGALAAAAAFAASLALSGWLFAPALPDDAPWYGGHLMQVGGLGHSEGMLLDATIGGRPIGRGRLPDGDAIRAAVVAGAPIRLRVEPGPRLGMLAPWLTLVDERQRELLLVGPAGDALVWRIRTRGRALRFELPDFAADGLLAGRFDGPPFDVAVTREGTGLCLRAAGRERCGVGAPPGRGWAHLLSGRRFDDGERRVLDALWLAACAAPLGFFLRRSRGGFVALALAAAALAALPTWLGLLPSTPADAAAAAAGVALGIAAGRGATRLREA